VLIVMQTKAFAVRRGVLDVRGCAVGGHYSQTTPKTSRQALIADRSRHLFEQPLERLGA
jgi:hypothetical protein